MFTQPESSNPCLTRKESVEAVHRAMMRFPLILDVLEKLGKSDLPFAGDEDIRHGCERALTSILVELARITPAIPGKSSKIEESTVQMLHSKAAERWINADQLQRIDQLVERVLGTHSRNH